MYKKLAVLLLMIFSSFCVSAQWKVGYEQDSAYVKLNREFNIYTLKQDTLQNVISRLRESVVSDPSNKEVYVDEILTIENDLFDIQSIIAGVTTRINGIKQDYILNTINKENRDALGVSITANSPQFVTDFLQKNLTAEELEIVTANANIDSLAVSAIREISIDYNRLQNLDSLLRVVDDRADAESLKSDADVIMTDIRSNEQVFKSYWDNLYETKLYAYRRILDILNIEQYMQYDLDKKEKELRRQAQSEAETFIAPALNNYNRQKSFLREYELVIASKQGDDITASLLKNIALNKDTLGFDKKIIELPKWEYVDYNPITFSTPYPSVAQIPYMVLPTRGKVFSVRVFVLSDKMKQISSIKGASPASYIINENGKWEYYLGIYKSQEEAQSGARALKLKGFGSPTVVEFKDGGKLVDGGTIVPLHVSDYYYSIELDMITPEITKKAKSIASDKSFARINNKYVLGVFDQYTDAIYVKDALGGASKIVRVEK